MMTEQEYISAAIGKLVTGGFMLSGTPTNATEFKEMYTKAQGDGTHAQDTSITWTQVKSKVTEVKEEYNLLFLRQKRDLLLQQSDWTQNRDVTLSNDADWKTYRQALRDITKTYKTLDDVTWPTKPE
jgi:uncharacterized protein